MRLKMMNEKLKQILPYRIYKCVEAVKFQGLIEEIRIRKNRQAYIIQNGKNKFIDLTLCGDYINKFVFICRIRYDTINKIKNSKSLQL